MIAYMFPGQGSQAKGMGGSLFDEFPQMTAAADEILGYSIKELCLNNDGRRLSNTRYTQPAIYVVNALSYQKTIENTGTMPDFFAGHSLGEYNALQAAGTFSFQEGLRLVKKRGELMAQAGRGAMAAVLGITQDEIKTCLDCNDLKVIDIANYNGPTQTVISGLPEDISRAQTIFERAGADYISLNTSGAFHSRYMAPIKTEFEDYLKQFNFSVTLRPVISNIHAGPYQQDRIKVDLANQITHPVKWQQSMEHLLDQGVDRFDEIGHGDVLSKILGYIKPHYYENRNIRLNESCDQIMPGTKNEEPDSQSIKTLNRQIEWWNTTYRIGTEVKVAGMKPYLKTKSEAMILLGHKAVIYLQGYDGYFALDDIMTIKGES